MSNQKDDLHQRYMIVMIWICAPSWFDGKASTFAEFQDKNTNMAVHIYGEVLSKQNNLDTPFEGSATTLIQVTVLHFPAILGVLSSESQHSARFPGFPKNHGISKWGLEIHPRTLQNTESVTPLFWRVQWCPISLVEHQLHGEIKFASFNIALITMHLPTIDSIYDTHMRSYLYIDLPISWFFGRGI